MVLVWSVEEDITEISCSTEKLVIDSYLFANVKETEKKNLT